MKASNHRFYNDLHYWLVISNNLKDVLDVIANENFDLSTDFVVAIRSEKGSYLLYDTYNLSKDRGSKIIVTLYGTWRSVGDLRLFSTKEKIKRRSNMQKFPLRVRFLVRV